MKATNPLNCAANALITEIAQFSFEYPLVVVPGAGPKDCLSYYLRKTRKTPRTVMRMDATGIPRVWGRVTGAVYRPAFVAMYALGNLNLHLLNGERDSLRIFLDQIDWLEREAIIRKDGAVIWPHHFNHKDGDVRLKAPWISANVQGFVISALVRGYRITRRPRLLELLHGAAKVFRLSCEDHGVRVSAEGKTVYTEIPGMVAPGVMDGFMRSLLGLYDLYVETGEPTAFNLFDEGINGLKHFLPRWDYKRKWSMYANRDYLSPPPYHCLNRLLLSVLGRLTGESSFLEYADSWNPNGLSALGRAEIFLAFVATKNRCRLKHKTWREACAQA